MEFSKGISLGISLCDGPLLLGGNLGLLWHFRVELPLTEWQPEGHCHGQWYTSAV